MPTFADLLTSYMARTGVGDAEFARRLGVSRLTLIRWKEGVTLRPRYREDVLRCAELLRLGPGERDSLLLAAGFAPAEPRHPEESGLVPDALDTEKPEDPEPASPETRLSRGSEANRPRKTALTLGVAAIAVVVLAGGGVVAVIFMGGPGYPTASDGESLILMAPFANYTAGQHGFNVRGRLKQEIDQEISKAGLSSVHTAEWPTIISSESSASDAGQRSGATIVIWGEFDSGRVMASFTVPQAKTGSTRRHVVDIDSSPSDLPTTINIDLPDEVRSIALLTLGQLYLNDGDFDLAKKVLIQAMANPPIDPDALAGLRYRLGRAYLGGELVDLDEAIWLFTQVLAVKPRSADTYSSRAVAYMERGRVGDSELALRDLMQVGVISPKSESLYVNRSALYLKRDLPGDIGRALDDLETALTINPDSANALVNRASAYLERAETGDMDRAIADLEHAIQLQPGLASAHVNLGNAHLDRGGESAFQDAAEEFSRAIEIEPRSAMAYYNRGLVYSALEDWDRSTGDLMRAQELRPNDPKFNNTVCWQLGLQLEAERALPYCNQALAIDPDGPARDSRGLVYSVMGRNGDAVEDFRVFLGWVGQSVKESCREQYRHSRLAWIQDLEAGNRPFDAEALRAMGVKPIASADDPC